MDGLKFYQPLLTGRAPVHLPARVGVLPVEACLQNVGRRVVVPWEGLVAGIAAPANHRRADAAPPVPEEQGSSDEEDDEGDAEDEPQHELVDVLWGRLKGIGWRGRRVGLVGRHCFGGAAAEE